MNNMRQYHQAYRQTMKLAGISIQAPISPYALGTAAKQEGESYMGTAAGHGVLPIAAASGVTGAGVAALSGSNIPGHIRTLLREGPGGVARGVSNHVVNGTGLSQAAKTYLAHEQGGLRAGLDAASELNLKNLLGPGVKGTLTGLLAGGGLAVAGNLAQYGLGHALANEDQSWLSKLKRQYRRAVDEW